MPIIAFILFFVILLPAMEVYLLFSWIGDSPFLGITYTIIMMLIGSLCIRLAKLGLGQALHYLQRTPNARHIDLRGFLILGKLWVIGILLFFPGYLTDIIALLIAVLIKGKGGDSHDEADSDADNTVIDAKARIIDET